ncbi:2Fe-2S iron-sulfur cluster binding domain-containing protein [Paraburkholderia fungorum]|uniref:2Fe-2S iron-sulfur cluster binding domain-containing protein n=1 Tax=Paraburkholderia fungorum TaxID=134537 RepID=A0A1H1JKB4_9BURK|nr:(2Fe-2S)-binding protein [Paraburkholderia fungorum]SDR49847.1 2Fe-2S iron-sulfur cluster binding domain-containing protein [Paraburkholderia fungorum]
MSGRFIRVGETARARVELTIDGVTVDALAGDTLLTAMLCSVRQVRQSEFGDEKRAGFCLMGACQDCWVWTADGGRLRACTTVVEPGMRVVTTQPEAQWANLAS